MTQKKRTVVTSKAVKPKKKQPLIVEIELQQQRKEDLELINKKLVQSRAELEAAYRKYSDLYDFAPVGYFTLARNGAIHQVNLAGANLLGVNHNEVPRLRMAAFVFSESQLAYHVFFEKLLSREGKETCELMFEKKENGLLWARLEATCFEGGDISRAALTDITERKLMEQALQESENRFRTTLQDAPTIAVQGYAMDGTTQYWNSASEKLYGYSAQEAIGQNLLDLIIPPEMRSDVWQAIQQMAKTGQPIPAAELSLMRKNGSRVAVYSSHTIFSAPGRAPELFCLDVDLTERKQSEAVWQTRLQLSQFADSHTLDELLQKTLDEAEILTGSQIGFAHFLEADQKTLQLQTWSTNTLKNCMAEGRGMHIEIDQAGVWADCVSARAPQIHNDYSNLPASHRKGLPEGHVPTVRDLVVPVMRNDLIVMIMGVGNKPTDYDDNDVETLSQLANLAWDIVQRKQAEEALKASTEFANNLINSMQDGVSVLDKEGVHLDVNGALCQMTGFSRAELIGTGTPHLYWPPEEYEHIQAAFQKTLISGVGNFELIFMRKNGERFPVIVSPFAVKDSLGNIVSYSATVKDITERKRAEDALRESQELLLLFMHNSPVYTYIKAVTPTESRVLQASDNFLQMIGISGRDMVGKTMHELFPAEFAAKITADDWAVIANGKVLKLDENLNDRHYTTIKFPIVQGDRTLLAGYTIDITERVRAEQALEAANSELQIALTRQEQLAHTDSLTGINNRRYLYELAEREFEVATRYQKPFSVIMFDIDHFKEVNDTFGHAAGDQILQRVTWVACAELRSADVIGRYGGEEFVVILPMTNAQQAYPLAERIRKGVAAIRMQTERGDASVTLSIGIVEKPENARSGSVENLIRQADMAMYAAKQAGRNRTEIGN